jgi:ATP-dependent Clp protease ATP-binding subunit ClpC
MLIRFRAKCSALYDMSLVEAKRRQHSYIGVEHVAIAFLSDPEYPLVDALKRIGLDAPSLLRVFDKEVGTGSSAAATLDATPRLTAILGLAVAEGELTPRLILRSILFESESLFARFLDAQGVSPQKLLGVLDGSDPSDASAEATRFSGPSAAITSVSPVTPASRSASQPPADAGSRIEPKAAIPLTFPTPTLDEWGRNLRALAEQGRLSDAIGREREIEQVITILARTQKSNPLLLGDAGVGKTAIVEGLAWRIANGLVPPILRGKRIVELDMGGLTAGTSLRGQFEERIQRVVKEASNAPEVILFIDEIHTIVGAGKGDGANDAAQMLKPALARGDLSCIGATTEDEFNRYIRKDQALERRFSPVFIAELRPEATRSILEKVAPAIIKKQAGAGYQLTIDPAALSAAVALTDKYVKDRNQPDKSIDAIDIACARAVVKGRTTVTAEDIEHVVSEWTGIPAGQLGADDRQRFAQIDAELEQSVVGQDAAVAAVSRSVRMALAGMKAANRPIGVFLFCGPSGVGKTKLAKELAVFMFGSTDALIRFDMNEYQDKAAISNLIGSARGYLDSEKGGQFTEALRRKPYSVVLLDEIEKAHPDILNTFLAVFDEGRVSDNYGRAIDCSNALFIMTSNLGANVTWSENKGQNDLRALAAQFLRPELVNRITEVVRFEPLGRFELSLVLEQVLREKLAAFRVAQRLDVMVDDSVKDLILSMEMDPQMGARPLERAVEQLLVQPLVDAVFAGQIKPGAVSATARAGRVAFSTATGRE